MARVLRYVIIGCSYFLLCEVLLSFKSVLKKERLSGFRVVLFIVIYNKLLNKMSSWFGSRSKYFLDQNSPALRTETLGRE